MSTITAKGIVGCIDRKGRPGSYGATAVVGYVIPGGASQGGCTWKELQPVAFGPIVGTGPGFTGSNPIETEIQWVRANAPALLLKLRVFTGENYAPATAMSLGGGPVYADAAHTTKMGVWWDTTTPQNYNGAWQDFQTKLAALYDGVPEIAESTFGPAATAGVEPFLKEDYTSTPGSANAVSLGWTYTAEETAMQASIDFMSTVWLKTPHCLAFNAPLWVSGAGIPAGESQRYMKAMIDRMRNGPRPLAVLENNSLRANQQGGSGGTQPGSAATTPPYGQVSSTGVVTDGHGGTYAPMYEYIVARTKSAYNSSDPGFTDPSPCCYQTSTLQSMSNGVASNETLGLQNTLNYAIALGARSVELPAGYDGAGGVTSAFLVSINAQLAANDVTRTYTIGGGGPTAPSAPVGVTVSGLADTLATLGWTPGSDGGSSVMRWEVDLILNGILQPPQFVDTPSPVVMGASVLALGSTTVNPVYAATAGRTLWAVVTGHCTTAFTCSDPAWSVCIQESAASVENCELWTKPLAAGGDTIPTWSGSGASQMAAQVIETTAAVLDDGQGVPNVTGIAGTISPTGMNGLENNGGVGRLVLGAADFRLAAAGSTVVTDAITSAGAVTVLGDNSSDVTKASHYHACWAISNDINHSTYTTTSTTSTVRVPQIMAVLMSPVTTLPSTVNLTGLSDSPNSYVAQVFGINLIGRGPGGTSPTFSPPAPIPPQQPPPYVPPIQTPDFTYMDTTRPGNWVFYGCDLMTNAVMAELPLLGTQLAVAIDAAGAWSANIPLSTTQVPLDLMDATAPGRTRLYAVRDGAVVFGGIIWTRNYDSTSETLQLGGNQFWSYYAHRRIKFTKAYKNVEQFAVVQDIIANLSLLAGDPGFAFNYVGGPTPTLVSASYIATDETQVDQAILTFAQALGGFDIAEDYYIDPATGYPNFTFTLSYPRRGQTGSQNADYVFELPGNIISYQWPEDATGGATTMTDTGGGSGTGQLQETASNTNLIDAGYPLLEGTTSHADVTDPGVLANLAGADLDASAPPVVIPVVTVNPAQSPTLGTYSVGYGIRLTIVDPRFNSGKDPVTGKYLSPGLDTFQRMISYQIFPQDDSQQESVAVTFGPDA